MSEEPRQRRELQPHELAAYQRALAERQSGQVRPAMPQFGVQSAARRVHREAHYVNGELHVVEDEVEFYDAQQSEQPLNQSGTNGVADLPWYARIFGI